MNVDVIYAISTGLDIAELAEPATTFLRGSFQLDHVCGSLLFALQERAPIDPHLEYIRENFSELLYREDVLSLPPAVLDQILSSDEIAIEDENQLAVWVSRVISHRGCGCKHLVDRLHLESLTSESMLELCRLEDVDAPQLLEAHRTRRSQPHANFPKRHFKVADHDVDKFIAESNGTTLEWAEGDLFRGIIDALQANAPRGFPLIRVTASSTAGPYFLENNLLDLESKHRCWYSEGKPNQWVTFDFSPRLLRASRYALRTHGADRNEGHMRSWVLLASNDNHTWIEIDRQIDRRELNGGYYEYTFPVSSDRFYRLYKLAQTDLNHRKDHAMLLSAVEFFGQIVPKI
jgi:hypothetical protein